VAVRTIVQIDEEKCNGCGQCIPNCAEGALQIIDGKARLVKEVYCDGLGACLGTCPQDAITLVEREAEEFDEQAAMQHVKAIQGHGKAQGPAVRAGCPGVALMDFASTGQAVRPAQPTGEAQPSALTQWPVQLHLVPEQAPFFQNADLLLAADCVPFAYAGFHAELLSGRKLLVGCPKLDDAAFYAEKLTAILKRNDVRSLTVVHMEVPCCSGLVALARRALAVSGKCIPVEEVTIGVRGDVLERAALNTQDR